MGKNEISPYRLTREEIKQSLNYLNGKWVDRYEQVPAFNELLGILGYKGYFKFNTETGKVSYKKGI